MSNYTVTYIGAGEDGEATAYPHSEYVSAPQWQPIETAPRDCSVWLWDGETRWIGKVESPQPWREGLRIIGRAYEKNGDFVSTHHRINPTHWMPLPQPPSEG